jgi:hypothetical protein
MKVKNERPALGPFFVALWQKQEVLNLDLMRDIPLQRMGLLSAWRGSRFIFRSGVNANPNNSRKPNDQNANGILQGEYPG